MYMYVCTYVSVCKSMNIALQNNFRHSLFLYFVPICLYNIRTQLTDWFYYSTTMNENGDMNHKTNLYVFIQE